MIIAFLKKYNFERIPTLLKQKSKIRKIGKTKTTSQNNHQNTKNNSQKQKHKKQQTQHKKNKSQKQQKTAAKGITKGTT